MYPNMTYKNPKWLQILVYFGLLFMPSLAIGSFYFVIEGIKSNALFPILFFSFGLIFFLYMEYLGLGLAKFLKAEIFLNEEGIKVISGKNINEYSWGQVGKVKNSIRLQLYKVYDKNDRPIFIVDHMIPGFKELKNIVEEKINI